MTSHRKASSPFQKLSTWFLAVPIGLLVHILVLSFFMMSSVQTGANPNTEREKAFLVNTAYSNNFNLFLRYSDPEAISKPNTEYGFSSVIDKNQRIERKTEPQTSWKNPKFRIRPSKSKTDEIYRFNLDSADKLVKIWKSIPVTASQPAVGGNGLAYPLCTSADGTVMEMELKNIGIEKILKDTPPKYVSIVRMTFSGSLFPRAELVSSSGNDILDLAALNTLIENHKRIRAQLVGTMPLEKAELIIHWKKGIASCSK